MKAFLTALFLISLSGCSAMRGEALRDRWKGETKDELLAEYGVPERMIKMENGGELIEFRYTNQWGVDVCRRNFLIENNIVTKVGWKGRC